MFAGEYKEMKIAIAGAGVSGSYMYRLLKNCDYDVTIYDTEHNTKCGIKPCAWVTSKGFEHLVERAGLNPEHYIIHRFNHVMIDDVRIKANMLIIDKPKLIKDLLGNAEIKNLDPNTILSYTGPTGLDYDKIIDATGVARAFLPPIDGDLIAPCYQYRKLDYDAPIEMKINISRVGYAWIFPLEDHEFHVGVGSLVKDAMEILGGFGLMPWDPENMVCKCSCHSRIRLTAPSGSRPFVYNNVWGIGEAIGCVAPLVSDGIVHSMKSALLLLENIERHPSFYVNAILREFAWMEKEREVVDRLRQGKMIGPISALALQRNAKRFDMEISLINELRLFWRMRK